MPTGSCPELSQRGSIRTRDREIAVRCPPSPPPARLFTKGRTMTEPSNDTPVLDLLAEMTAASIVASSLDAETLALVRIAALVAVDAPPASYLLNLEAA